MIQGSLKEADYVAAQWLHMKPRPIMAVVGILLLLLALWAFFISPSWTLGLALGVLALMFFVYTPLKARRTFRLYKALSEPMSVELRDDGLHFRRESGEGVLPWSHIIKLKYSERLLLLYPTDALFYLLPSHFFETEAAFKDFVAAIESRVGGDAIRQTMK